MADFAKRTDERTPPTILILSAAVDHEEGDHEARQAERGGEIEETVTFGHILDIAAGKPFAHHCAQVAGNSKELRFILVLCLLPAELSAP